MVCSRNARLFNIQKLINVIHHIYKKKKKSHIISIDTREAYDKIQYPLIKTFSKLENFLNLIKDIYIIFSKHIYFKKLSFFLLKIRKK